MGYHHHEQGASSGVVVAVAVAIVLLVLGGLLLVAVGGLFFLGTAKVSSHAVATPVPMVDQGASVTAERPRAVAYAPVAPAKVASALAPERILVVTLDQNGNARIDGEEIDLDELKLRLAKWKDETSNTFVVQLSADHECRVQHLIPVVDACEEVGDIDFRITSHGEANLAEEAVGAGRS